MLPGNLGDHLPMLACQAYAPCDMITWLGPGTCMHMHAEQEEFWHMLRAGTQNRRRIAAYNESCSDR